MKKIHSLLREIQNLKQNVSLETFPSRVCKNCNSHYSGRKLYNTGYPNLSVSFLLSCFIEGKYFRVFQGRM